MTSSYGADDAAAVRAALSAELVRGRASVSALDPRLRSDVDRLVEFASRGKLLRSQFLCWGFRAAPATAGDEPLPPQVARAAAALELIQACALLHDDIIDRSDTRRGLPSTHRAVAKTHAGDGWAGDSDHYGVSVVLLLGDLALAWADDLFVDAAIRLRAADRALPVWKAMRTEVLSGQLLDLLVAADLAQDAVLAERDAMQVNRLKTAAYTVGRPLHLGAALAGAPASTIDALRGYGTSIGLAFQLRDDQLGVFGDPVVTGKPIGGDLIEGKRTVLLARARSALDPGGQELAALDSGLGAVSTAAEVEALTRIVAQSGAPEQVERMIDELTASGVAAIAGLDPAGRPAVDPAVQQALVALAAQSTRRSS